MNLDTSIIARLKKDTGQVDVTWTTDVVNDLADPIEFALSSGHRGLAHVIEVRATVSACHPEPAHHSGISYRVKVWVTYDNDPQRLVAEPHDRMAIVSPSDRLDIDRAVAVATADAAGRLRTFAPPTS